MIQSFDLSSINEESFAPRDALSGTELTMSDDEVGADARNQHGRRMFDASDCHFFGRPVQTTMPVV